MAYPRNRRHIIVPGEPTVEKYTPHSRKIEVKKPPAPASRRAHGAALKQSMELAVEEAADRRDAAADAGITVHGATPGLHVQFESQPGVPLKLTSLDDARSGIEIVAVTQSKTNEPDPIVIQRATVFVPDGKVKHFITRFAQYSKTAPKKKGERRHEDMLDPVATLRLATLRGLWTDAAEVYPNDGETIWWEVWLRRHDGNELARLVEFASLQQLDVAERRLQFHDRIVTLVRATAAQLSASVDVLNDVAEVQRAKETAAVFVDVGPEEQADWAKELLGRITAPDGDAPAACILDTGITRGHPQDSGDRISSEFLLYALRGMREEFRRATMGSTHQTIYMPDIRRLTVPLPPREEQDRVVRFLRVRLPELDELIAKRERLVDLVAEKRQVLLTQAVTKGLDATVPMKDSGVDWIGQVPVHWNVATLSTRYQIDLGKMLSPEVANGPYPRPYLANQHVRWDRVVVDELPTMSIEPHELKRFTLRDGDLLVCEGGEAGRTAMWRGELEVCAYQKARHRLRTRSPADVARYLYFVMVSAAARGLFETESNRSTFVHLTGEKFRRHRFPFPPASEQSQLPEHLDRVVGRLNDFAQRANEQVEKLREYRQALITAAVTGQLDVSAADTSTDVFDQAEAQIA